MDLGLVTMKLNLVKEDAVKQMINDNPDLMDELETKIKAAIKNES